MKSHPHQFLLSTLASLLTCAGSAAAAVTITTATGTNGADSYVTANSSINNGTANIATAKWGGTGGSVNRFAYLRFDLTGQTFDPTPAAALKLTTVTSNGNATFEVFGLNDLDAGESWGETTLNWTNKPASTGLNDNTIDLTKATSLGTFAFNGGADGSVSTFSSTSLDNFLLADTNDVVTFIIRRTTNSTSLNSIFATKENTSFSAPSLTFVPEPSAALLGGLGLLSLLRRRR